MCEAAERSEALFLFGQAFSFKEKGCGGTMNPKGSFVDLICDATIAMPLIYAALKERL